MVNNTTIPHIVHDFIPSALISHPILILTFDWDGLTMTIIQLSIDFYELILLVT